mmetsp:Transcript_62561/g.116336  ORF Transcript_62561/g.116336 Transcript_62561/m.116336 type:complete len:370 (+) Transcript_62561:126-1235(+)
MAGKYAILAWVLLGWSSGLPLRNPAQKQEASLPPVLLQDDSTGRVPIVTGCVKLCGVEDQSCATQCEVCVEMAKCRTDVDQCDACAKKAEEWKRASSASQDWARDAGGIPMRQDEARTRLQRAAFSERDGLHSFRRARLGVLKAQRQAEWAQEERHEEAERLRESKAALKGARGELDKWELQNSRKVKDMDKEMAEKAEAVRILEGQLEKEVKNENRAADVRSLEDRLRAKKQELANAQQAKDARKEDAEWYRDKLQKDVSDVEADLKLRLQHFHAATVREKVSRQSLEEAKETYRVEATTLQERGEQKDKLEAQFQNYTAQLPASWRRRLQEGGDLHHVESQSGAACLRGIGALSVVLLTVAVSESLW